MTCPWILLDKAMCAAFKGGGPGLGLAIARRIVQTHGGRIWVDSPGCDEDQCPGSAFYILLPVA